MDEKQYGESYDNGSERDRGIKSVGQVKPIGTKALMAGCARELGGWRGEVTGGDGEVAWRERKPMTHHCPPTGEPSSTRCKLGIETTGEEL